MLISRFALAVLVATPVMAQVPHVDLSILDITPPPDVDLVVVRERYYGAGGVDLSTYGIGAGPVDYVQSIYVRFYHGTPGQNHLARGRLVFPANVTVLGLITTPSDLGGTVDDGVWSDTDLLFGVGADPDAYSAPGRGINWSDQDYVCLRGDGSVHFNLQSRHDSVTDFRVIIDYGAAFPANASCNVEHLNRDARYWMGSKATLHYGIVVGDIGGAVLGSGDFGEVPGLDGLPLINGVAPTRGAGQSVNYPDSIFFNYGGGTMSNSSLQAFDLVQEQHVPWMQEGGSSDPSRGPDPGRVYFVQVNGSYSYSDLVSGQHNVVSLTGVTGHGICHHEGTREMLLTYSWSNSETKVWRIDVDTQTVSAGPFTVPVNVIGRHAGSIMAGGKLYILGEGGVLAEMDPTNGAYTTVALNGQNGLYRGMEANAAGTQLFLLRKRSIYTDAAVDLYDIAAGFLTSDWILSTQRIPAGITMGPNGLLYVSDNGSSGGPWNMAWLKAFDPATGAEQDSWPCADFFGSVGIVGAVGDGMGDIYCQPAVANSNGETGWMAATGSAVVADNDLWLEAHRLPKNQNAMFLMGDTQGFVAGPAGSQGNLCLGGYIRRFAAQVQSSGPFGIVRIQMDLNNLPNGGAVTAGQTWNFQCWHRDIGSKSNFTDGLSVTFN